MNEPPPPAVSAFAQTMTEAFAAYHLTFADVSPAAGGTPRVHALSADEYTAVEVWANDTLTRATQIILTGALPATKPDVVKRNAQLATHIALVVSNNEAGVSDWLAGVLRLAKLTKRATEYALIGHARIAVRYDPKVSYLTLSASVRG